MAQLRTHFASGIGTIVLSNLPKHNAMTFDMWCALPNAIRVMEEDPEIRLIVLEGDGQKAFVSGSDISQFETQRTGPEAKRHYNDAVSGAHLAAERCSKPVIAKIRGFCIGGGVGLAASCDVRLCADDARFRIPAARIGIGYPVAGVRRLLPLIGPQNLLDILFSARSFGAEEALRIGLIAHVYPAAQFDDMAGEWLSLAVRNAPLTMKAVKMATAELAFHAMSPASEAVEAAIADCFTSADYKEGTKAFLEKRVPAFVGH